jgi:hypothetical protein
VLRRQLTAVIAATALVATACAGADGTERGAIRENVIEPGITAIDESQVAACGAEASSFRTALEAYDLLEGEPAPDEAAMIAAGLLRNESELWDVVDGRLVPQDPACGNVLTTVPTEEIVTEPNASGAAAVDEIMAAFTADDIAGYGGPECARQLAAVFAGADEYAKQEGKDPDTLADVDAAGYLAEPVTMWQVVDGSLRPAPGSTCLDFVAAMMSEACTTEIQTLRLAIEAYVTEFDTAPSYQDLVDEGLVQEQPPDEMLIDVVDGQIEPVAGSGCDRVESTDGG